MPKGKTTLEKLQEAIASGDLGEAGVLAAELAAAAKKRASPKKEEDSSWVAPSLKTPPRKAAKGVKPTFCNRFVDDGAEAAELGLDRLVNKNAASPRTGPGREAVAKVGVVCEGCRKPFKVYPSALKPAFDDAGRTNFIYKCNACDMRGG